MERKSKIIQLVLWSLIAALLTVFLCHELILGGRRGWSWNFAGWTQNASMATDYSGSFPASGIRKIDVQGSSMDVVLTAADSDSIGVTDRTTDNADDQSDVTVSSDDGVLKITGKNWSPNFYLFGFGRREELEVSLPAAYAGDLAVGLVSGDTTFRTNVKLGGVSISGASGDVTAAEVQADSFTCHITSGDIRLQALQARTYSVASTSGDIGIDRLSGAGSLANTSGDIRAAYDAIGGASSVAAHSGDVQLTLGRSAGADVTARCVSGDIQADFPLQYTGREKNNASGRVGGPPNPKLDISTLSGDIDLHQG